jgi:hypothetical protein
MSPLATLAQEWYQQYLPQAYEGIEDKPTFFGTLGEQAAQEIDQVADQLAGPDIPGEVFTEKLGRLTQARTAATELVLRQTLLALLPPDWPDSDYPSQATPDPGMAPKTPDASDLALAEAMAEFQEAQSELAQQNRNNALKAMPVLPDRPEHLNPE